MSPRPRVLVFEDSVYRADEAGPSTDRAFLHYVTRLVDERVSLVLLGRVDPAPGRSFYAVPPQVDVTALPYYPSLVHPAAPAALLASLRRSWQALGEVDVAWLMGPHPLALGLLVLAQLRGIPVVLGVRQDLPRYARERHPARRWTHVAADLLERCWRLAARRRAVVAVGPELSRNYAVAKRLLPLSINLVPADAARVERPRHRYDGELCLLSVGRLEQEKNPLLLADVLALLRASDPRWRLRVCGQGSLEPALRARLVELGVAEHAELLGYVPVDAGLLELYRASHAFVHVSWTEGLPQVLFEAWASGTPVVATAVGGVAEAAGTAALLVPPGDAAAAAHALLRVAQDEQLRDRLRTEGDARLAAADMAGGLRAVRELLVATAAAGRP